MRGTTAQWVSAMGLRCCWTMTDDTRAMTRTVGTGGSRALAVERSERSTIYFPFGKTFGTGGVTAYAHTSIIMHTGNHFDVLPHTCAKQFRSLPGWAVCLWLGCVWLKFIHSKSKSTIFVTP